MTRSRTAALAVATAAVLTVLPSAAALGSAAGTVAVPVPAASVDDPAVDRRTTWTIGPAGADGPDSRTSIRHAVDPGETVTDHVAVTNFGPDPATFRVYAGDGVVGDDGAFDILPRDREPTDGGRWVTVEDAPGASRDADGSLTVTLEPESTVVVPVTIAVPQDATPGDHPAGAVAEIVPAGTLPVEVSTRVGVRLHLRVTGEIEAGVVASDLRTTWEPSPNPLAPGSVVTTYTLQNTGNVRVGTDTLVRVAGPFGALASETVDSRRELLPGQQVTARTEVPLWGLVRARAEVTVDAAAVGEDPPLSDVAPGRVAVGLWAVPWAQVVVVLLAAALALLRRRRRRRAERAIEARIDAAVSAATSSGDGPSGAGRGQPPQERVEPVV